MKTFYFCQCRYSQGFAADSKKPSSDQENTLKQRQNTEHEREFAVLCPGVRRGWTKLFPLILFSEEISFISSLIHPRHLPNAKLEMSGRFQLVLSGLLKKAGVGIESSKSSVY